MADQKVKTYCYEKTCDIVEGGFHLEKYPVCRACKSEISENLKNTIESRNKKIASPESNDQEEWDFDLLRFDDDGYNI